MADIVYHYIFPSTEPRRPETIYDKLTSLATVEHVLLAVATIIPLLLGTRLLLRRSVLLPKASLASTIEEGRELFFPRVDALLANPNPCTSSKLDSLLGNKENSSTHRVDAVLSPGSDTPTSWM